MNGAGGEGKNTVVCVTGASGYIASWLVKLLLQRGYTVKATVRNLKDPKKTEHITSLEGAKQRLHLFEADLLEEGSFDSIIHGCHGVFHTASPCFFECTEPQTQLIEPAVKGTLNVLTSCAKSLHSVKRVILTSSIAAILLTGTPLTPQTLVDETWFSNPQICKDIEFWYVLSKTLAEEAAWKFVKEKGIDMVAINPSMVLGPLLQPTLNFSCSEIWKVVNNDLGTYPNYSYGWVHVYDVADAHIRALEIPSANGRYCLTESVVHNSDIFNLLLKLYPNLKLSNKCEDGPVMPTFLVSKERAKSLGIKFIPLEMGLKETIESLKEKKFVTLHYHDS